MDEIPQEIKSDVGHISDEAWSFIKLWNSSKSLDKASETIQMDRALCVTKASILRWAGFELKKFTCGKKKQPKVILTEKHCPKCNETKSAELFYKGSSALDGLDTYCKECHNETSRQWKANNRERHLKYQREYRRKKKEKTE